MNGAVLFILTNTLAFLALGVALYTPDSLIGLSWALTLASLISLLATLRAFWGSWITLSQFFVLFFALYTLSGPYEVLFGSGQIAPFSPPFLITNWLIDASVAIIAFSLGMLLIRFLAPLKRDTRVIRPVEPGPYRFAIMFMAAATSSELTNLTRVGFSALLGGKAIYQGKVSELTLALPSSIFALLAFGLLGLSFANYSVRKVLVSILPAIIIAFPLLVVHLILGQRLELATYLIAFTLGWFYRRPLARFPARTVCVGLALYLIFSPIYAFRWTFPLILSGETISLSENDARKLLLSSLNPALNEFGASFGNYSTFLQAGDFALLWGKSYLKDLTVVIPRFLYPGEKPKSIVYEFRDTFFSDWANNSTIAGTAFSSLLEARWNFGNLGPLLVFFSYGLLLGMLERMRLQTHSLWFASFYTSFSMFVLIVHRSSTGGTLSAYFWVILLIAGMYILSELLKPLWKRKRKAIVR